MWEPTTQRGLFANGLLWLIGIVLVCTVIGVAGWRLNWWLQAKQVNFQSHIIRNSYSNQQTLREEITSRISDVLTITTQMTTAKGAERDALGAQRLAVLAIVCQDSAEVRGDPLSSDQAGFIGANCFAGAVSPNSTYNANGG